MPVLALPDPFDWTFPATVLRVIDGDTLHLRVDLGFHLFVEQRVRLLGVDAYELNSPLPDLRLQAVAGRDFVIDWVADAIAGAGTHPWPFHVETHKGDAFGRWLVKFYRRDTGKELGAALLEAGLARPYRR